ncbi:hypothetical protein HHK36_006803 [Tetracentron sinense]|uniref:BHLH domain-containing protein n=1 Tax=Tetracentron sinense TaxID=13715 RepID=A0A835DL47_TETSI|nr:hypothetical protein HHK36_006803 [Tetracentron sinense]
MALAKERAAHESLISLIQTCSFYGNVYGGSPVQVSDPSSLELYGFDNYHKIVLDEGEGSERTSGSVKNLAMTHPLSLSDSNSVMFCKEAQSVINFKTGYDNFVHAGGSLLSFEQGEDYSSWADGSVNHNYQWNLLNPSTRLSEDLNCLETSSSFGSMNSTAMDDQHGEGDERLGWLYSATVATDTVQVSGGQEACFHKRPHMGDDIQAHKKHCTGAPRKPKVLKSIPSKDPQSIAAKNRRERISERLKILQDLVPNGTKVDLVTMLEKAISYVKFLQLQVKVLATDEFWPVQGGKAPEVAQVKEAIDAILSSDR